MVKVDVFFGQDRSSGSGTVERCPNVNGMTFSES
jgi:hypothetical protein